MNELRQALRFLKNSRGVTLVAILALALGIGANTAIFSVVNAVFLRPLPYEEADRLVEVTEYRGGESSVSYPNFLDWRQQADVFEHFAISGVFDAGTRLGGAVERLQVGWVSSEFLPVFRVKPILGRDFRPEDDREGSASVAILTHRLWQTRFGSNPAVLGSTISVDQRPYTVIGVLPPGFRFYRESDLFIPISDAVVRQVLNLRDNHNSLHAQARLKPGVTLEKAGAQMAAIAARLERAYPASNTGLTARVYTLRERISGNSRNSVMMLLGAVALVLLIACVNVANLLLARAADRKKEMAVRAALGASRWDVLRQLLLESVLLAVAGGALGTLFARWSFAGLVRLVPAALTAGGLSIDLRVLGFTMGVCLLTGILFGLFPAWDALKLDLNDAMRDGTRTTGATSSRGRLRDALVVAEVSLALVLLVGAGLLLRTLDQLMNVHLGFTPEKTLAMHVSLPDNDEFEQGAAFFSRLTERVRAMPGVRSTGTISQLPLGNGFSSAVFWRDDRPIPPRGELPAADQRVAAPEYFASMGIPLVRGRLFTPADGRITNFRRSQVMEWFGKNNFAVVINESMAKRFWPGEDPIGKSYRFGFPEMKGPRLTVIGVVGDTRDYGPDNDAPPTWFFSAYHFPQRDMRLVVRTRTQPESTVAAIRRAATELDPSAMISEVTTLDQMVTNSVASRRLNMLLLSIFALLALVLAAVGIYGVMAYAVNRRRHEIGIRMALGAAQGDILGLVIRKAVILGGLGVLIGSVAALGLTRLIRSMLHGVSPADPLTFGCVAAGLFAIAVAASCAPARRASRVSPLTALRCE